MEGPLHIERSIIMDQTNELLTRQLDEEIRKLSTMEDGSEEKIATVNGINQMYRLKIEEYQMNEELKAQKAEVQRQEKFDVIDRIIEGSKVVVSVVGGIAIPIIFMNRGFKFEETGVYKSQTFKNLFGKFRLK